MQPATLIDWQDVGIGMPEFDLAYLDLQPFESARLIPRSELLDLYWRYRAEIRSEIPCRGRKACPAAPCGCGHCALAGRWQAV